MPKGRVVIDEDRCKGCELCVVHCPFDVLALADDRFNAKGYRPAQMVHPEKCTGCQICAIVCPDAVITVYKQVKVRLAGAPA